MSDVLPTPEGPHTTIGLGILARSASGFFGATTSGRSAETRLTSASRAFAGSPSNAISASKRRSASPSALTRAASAIIASRDASDSVNHARSRRSCSSIVDGPTKTESGGFPSGTFIRPGIAVASFDAQNAANASCASTEGRFTRQSFSSAAADSRLSRVMPYVCVIVSCANCVSHVTAKSPAAASKSSRDTCSMSSWLHGAPCRASGYAPGSASHGYAGSTGLVVTIFGNANTSGNSSVTRLARSAFSKKLGPARTTGFTTGFSVSLAGITSE